MKLKKKLYKFVKLNRTGKEKLLGSQRKLLYGRTIVFVVL